MFAPGGWSAASESNLYFSPCPTPEDTLRFTWHLDPFSPLVPVYRCPFNLSRRLSPADLFPKIRSPSRSNRRNPCERVGRSTRLNGRESATSRQRTLSTVQTKARSRTRQSRSFFDSPLRFNFCFASSFPRPRRYFATSFTHTSKLAIIRCFVKRGSSVAFDGTGFREARRRFVITSRNFSPLQVHRRVYTGCMNYII